MYINALMETKGGEYNKQQPTKQHPACRLSPPKRDKKSPPKTEGLLYCLRLKDYLPGADDDFVELQSKNIELPL
jgi:hypothetical protein